MVKHQPLQVYEKQVFVSFVTGIYGCRWKRYQRSHDDSSKILACFHISLGQQLNLYWVSIHSNPSLFTCVYLSCLQSTAPFLHLGALAVFTALGWLVAGYVVRRERSNFQVMVLLIYVVLLLLIYLAPLTFRCPCVMNSHSLAPRPEIIGRRGAPMLAPENTMVSFNRALQQGVSSLQADVTISEDGVPFLMRDDTLRRTTDVGKVFPSRQHDDASSFNWTDLRALNAGQWFLESDPYWTADSLSAKERGRAGNQTVCPLVEMLRLAARANRSALLNVRRPPPQHPRHRSWFMDTLWVIQRSGIPQKRVTWTPDTDRGRVRGLQQAADEMLSLEEMRQRGVSSLTLRLYWRDAMLPAPPPREYLANNVSVTVYPVNEAWLYSLLWCSGVPSVSSDAPQDLRKVPYPIWLMSQSAYCFIWITSDLVSIAVVLVIFSFQKWKMSGMQNYNPEHIMLSAVTRRASRDVNVMKEKLIFSELNNGLNSTEDLSLNLENGYASYSCGGH
uniref:Glycerophosphodiester phosphodiesterase domain containing 5a n=1 Tax=Gadus morhua TaxID=8049 RepID=A0A8C4Z9H3_GADMO